MSSTSVGGRTHWSLALALLAITALAVALPAPAGAATEGQLQYPFACTAQDAGLELVVDNQDGDGVEVRGPDGELLGWSRDCFAETRYWYFYVDTDGDRRPLVEPGGEAPAALPDDVATTTLTDGREVPYLIRHERGVINRFVYSVSMLATAHEVLAGDPTHTGTELWNGRLLYQFQGGVGIGHSQGRYDDRGITGDPDRLAGGYAVIYSTATRTGDHYNLLVGGRTAEAVKAHFVATYGEPDYTVGIGASGGGIQQYVYGQNHPDLLDAAIPQQSYPDMTTQTIHVGDCALLDRYMDVDAADDPTWQDWDNRQWLQGLNSIEGYLGSTARQLAQIQAALGQTPQSGSSECLEGWFGLSALALNPHYGNEENWDLLPDDVVAAIEKTHWSDVVEAYGRDPETGFARVPWDNVGVQYGLRSVADGRITPEQFLDVNAKVGSWKDPEDMVQEGFPFVGSVQDLMTGAVTYDPWSLRNQRTADGDAPAPRRAGDVEAIRAAHTSGLVFTGDTPRDIPIIDVRPYLEHVLDMHNSHQSFAVRQRLLDGNGHADNHAIWFLDTDARGDSPAEDTLTHHAFDTIAQWMANLAADASLSVPEAAPDAATDSCFAVDGSPIATGDGVWAGILDEAPAGTCTEAFPIHSTSRIEAGGPITGDVYKCHTMPVATAVEEGLYGDWRPDAGQVARLEAIFPTGVCDYDLPDVGNPAASVADAPDVRQVGNGNLQVVGAPRATVELRQDGVVVREGRTNPAGRLLLPKVSPGTYTLRLLVDGEPGLRTEPVEVIAKGGGRR